MGYNRILSLANGGGLPLALTGGAWNGSDNPINSTGPIYLYMVAESAGTTKTGINTTSPTASLEVVKGIAISPFMVSSVAGGNGDFIRVTFVGDIGIGTTSPGARTHIVTAAATKGLIVQGAASQTANLQEWQNSAGTALAFMDASGNFNAITKSFNIPHPTKEGGRLRYASLEGPENSVYVRGSIKGVNEVIIYLPEYWPTLVHEDSLTVQTTAVGFAQPTLFVKEKSSSHIVLSADGPISVDYMICAERRDVPKLEVES